MNDMKWMVLNTLRQRAGIDVVRARKNPGTMDFIENRRINLVLDVGANTGQTATSFDPNAEFKASESVVVKTLDEAAPPRDLSSNVLLKIDTQGYERPVLEGAKETLKHVSGVLLELPIINIYKDNWRFHEAVAYMNDSGFVLAQVHPVNIHERAKDSATEFDCLFRPIDPTID